MKYYLFVIFNLLVAVSLAQDTIPPPDATLLLNEVEISADQRLRSIGNSTDIISNASSGLTLLSTELSRQTPVFIKSYSPGGLSTSGLRGGQAAHTAFLWNDIPLNHPQNGVTDLSLIPAFVFDKIQVEYGATGTTSGSGAIAGSINLYDQPDFTPHFKGNLQTGGGSFGAFSGLTGLSRANGKNTSAFKYWNSRSKNNYRFNNIALPGSSMQELTNAQYHQQGLLLSHAIKFKKGFKLNGAAWWQKSARGIPPTMLERTPSAHQKDELYRMYLKSELNRGKLRLKILQALLYESILFTDSIAEIDALSSVLSSFTTTEAAVNAGRNFNVGVNGFLNLQRGEAAEYAVQVFQQIYSGTAFLNYNGKRSRLKLRSEVRKELALIGGASPWIISSGAEFRLSKNIILYGNGGTVFRRPTLNDLHWQPGGNPLLKPEHGESVSAGLRFKRDIGVVKALYSAEIYGRRVRDQIIWQPGSSGYWSPVNYGEISTSGTEQRLKVFFFAKRWKLSWSNGFNYTISVPSKGYENAGLQLPYVPVYSLNSLLSGSYKNFEGQINLGYTGYVYTAPDHSFFLKPYSLTDMRISKKVPLKKHTIDFFAMVQNALNTQYMIMAWRPMPPRNYQAGLSLTLNLKNNEN